FTHTAADGTVVTFDANTTAMVDNGDGTYTFTNANGDTITIDSVGDIINNFEDFVTNNPVTVDGTTYTSVEEYFETIVTSNSDVLRDNGDGTFTHTAADGTVVTFDANTTAMVDNGDGTYTFTNANGDTITIDSVGDIINNFEDFVTNSPVTVDGTTYTSVEEYFETIVTSNSDALVDNGDGTFTHTAADGTVVTFDANTTAMLDNGDGTYTFTNANGDTITIDSVGDIISTEEDRVRNSAETGDGTTYTSVEEYFETIVTSNSDALVDNGDGTFTHTAADGTVVTFDANTTAMLDNGDGTYTFTNANGDTITIDSVGDIINNFEEFVTNSPVTVDGTTYTSVEEYFENIVAANETVTTLGITAGELVYVNEEANNPNVNLISADANNGIIAGTDGALFGKNIYNADGALTGTETTRNLDINGKTLRFNGTDRRTHWDSEGRIHQTATNPAVDAAMGFHNGNANLWIQQWSGESAITASDNSTALSLGTHYTQVAAPIIFNTSTGGNTTGAERMRITGEGEIIFAEYPNTRDDSGITAVENILYTDANGNMLSAPIGEVAIEPWQVQTTTDKATENTDNVYQMGSVAIGTNEIPTLTVGGNDLTST